MRGYEHYNYQAFEFGAAYLRALGHEVVSPHDVDLDQGWYKADYNWGWPDGKSWVDLESVRIFTRVDEQDFDFKLAMRHDIRIITQMDAVSFLPGWEESEGCRIEDYVRNACGIPRFVHEPFKYFHLHGQLAIEAGA